MLLEEISARVTSKGYENVAFVSARNSGLTLRAYRVDGSSDLWRAVGPIDADVTTEQFRYPTDELPSRAVAGYTHLETIETDDQEKLVLIRRQFFATMLAELLEERHRNSSTSVEQMVLSITRGIRDLHAIGLYHGSLNVNNIAFSSNEWKIVDFGTIGLVSPQQLPSVETMQDKDLRDLGALVGFIATTLSDDGTKYRLRLSEIASTQEIAPVPMSASELTDIIPNRVGRSQTLVKRISQAEDRVVLDAAIAANEFASKHNLAAPTEEVRQSIDRLARSMYQSIVDRFLVPEVGMHTATYAVQRELLFNLVGRLYGVRSVARVVDNFNPEPFDHALDRSLDNLFALSDHRLQQALGDSDILRLVQQAEVAAIADMMTSRTELLLDGLSEADLVELGLDEGSIREDAVAGAIAELRNQIAREPSLGAADVIRRSNGSETLEAIARLVSEGQLLGWADAHGEVRLPTFQFDASDFRPLPPVTSINAELRGVMGALATLSWWLEPTPGWADASPSELIRSGYPTNDTAIEAVFAAARERVERVQETA